MICDFLLAFNFNSSTLKRSPHRFWHNCRQSAKLHIFHIPTRVPPQNSRSQDIMIRVGLHIQVAKTPTYPVMCPFSVFVPLCDHNPPRLQRQTEALAYADAVRKQEAFEKCWAHLPLRANARRLFYIAIHQVSLLSHAACASMSTTTSTTTTTRDRGDRYGPMKWAQISSLQQQLFT